jgi:hypothetical protein
MLLYNPTVSGSLLITGSLTTTGTLTAQTLVVQTVTSSVDFVTGSSVNGSLSSNTHQFTGSVLITGSNAALLSVNNSVLYVSASGNVGIGTSSPSTKLHVYEALSNASAYLTVQNNRARNAAVYTVTSNGGFYAGTSIGTDTFNYQIYDGVAGAARITITSTGVLELTSGQLKFPASQNASADANTLDDYEEGTWTPIIGGEGGQSGQSYSGQTGYYTKIGRIVTVTFRVVLTNKGTITGNAAIKGLPFTADASGTSHAGGVTYFENLATSWSSIFLMVTGGQTYATIDGVKSAATLTTRATTSDIGNSTQFNGSFTYFV